MADLTFATYQFLPWARRGMAAQISQDDTLGASGGTVLERATVPVTVELNDATISTTNQFTLLGPGDIIGIKSDEIIRSEPLDGISNYEPNYLAYIEFYDEDFPWRYTPARAVGPNSEKLRPWLALIVLRETEFEETKRRQPLPSIKVTNTSALQSPNELHLWAHTHSNLPDPTSDQEAFIESLEKAYKTDPDGLYSRILCPRHLVPNALYHAFLVPSYETGRLAGLGMATDKVPAQQPSWGAQSNDNELPVYHRWMFRTGENFDFESLVKLLEPRIMDKRVGVRPMNCSQPGFVTATANPANPGNEVRGIDPPVMMLEGALLAPSTERDPATFPNAAAADFISDLKALIDLNSGYEEKLDSDPVVTVPFYGMYHAMQPKFVPADNLLWYNELNRDPRTRVAAGFGTRMVQENQEKFMDSAWKQLKNVLEANKKMHAAQVTAKVAEQMHAKHIAPLLEEKVISMARTLAARVPLPIPVSGRSAGSDFDGPAPRPTVKNEISRSAIPDALFMHPFRRAMRNNSSVMRGLQRKGETDTPDITPMKGAQQVLGGRVRSFNANLLNGAIQGSRAGFISAAPTIIFQGVGGVGRQLSIPSDFEVLKVWSLKSNLDDDFIYNLPDFTGGLPNVIYWGLVFGPGVFEPGVLGGPIGGGGIFLGGQTNFFLPNLMKSRLPKGAARPAGEAKSNVTEDFKNAFVDLNARTSFVENLPVPTQPDLTKISAATKQYVKPGEAYVRLIKSAVSLPANLKTAPNKKGDDDFLPVMAYPDYPDPTYEFLRDIDKELLLPNLDLIPPNTLSLLRTNQRFIESYLVGVNYEMGRELLWREYPTDMRGSYFRQFWDVRGIISPTTLPPDSEEAKDIKPIHTWLEQPPMKPDRRALGLHNARDLEGDAEQLVFVVRGDLLKKFPNTVIYAQKAEILVSGKRGIAMGLTGDEFKKKILFPQYKAEIQPDIKLFGFDLTIKEAAGIDKGKGFNDNLGWYFIIAEVPGEPRFGMDLTFNRNKPDLLTWNDLSWENFGGQELGFVEGHTPPTNFTVSDDPDTPGDESPSSSGIWARSSADMASILFQRPVMIATHATEMLDRKFDNPDESVPITDKTTLYDHVKPYLK